MITTIENDKLRVAIKSIGAEITSIKTVADGREFMWAGAPDVWSRQSPLLFPIVGRLNGGVCRIGDKQYHIGKHGFARDSEFELVTSQSDKLIYELRESEGTLKVFPYRFVLRVIYTLIGNALEVAYEVENLNEGKMYFSIGAHPAFATPLGDGIVGSDYYLQFEQKETADRWHVVDGVIGACTEKYLDDDDRIVLDNDVFNDDALIFKGLKSQSVSLKCTKHGRVVKVRYSGFKYLGLWAKPGARYVCIEPWFGFDDNKGFDGQFSEKEGIERLDSGDVFRSKYTVSCK